MLAALAIALLALGCRGAGPAAPAPGEYQGTDLGGDPAPEIRLTDQHGQSVALSDFRGKVVALTFFDPHCADVCPLTALELRRAAEVLGPDKADRVAFLAVNVNDRVNSPADVAEFTAKHQLAQVPNWHFLTGAPPQLEAAARDYFVYAVRSDETRVDHTGGIFIIDPDGRRQLYLDVPPEQAVKTRPGDLLARQMQQHLH